MARSDPTGHTTAESSLGRAAALIIAGGRGTRFWPLGRRRMPKPLFSLDGKRSLLAGAIARLQPLIARERIFVLAPAEQKSALEAEVGRYLPARNFLTEPSGRGTAVGIAYGAAIVERRLGPSLIAVTPADHYVAPAGAFHTTMRRALKLASRHRAIVVIGVTPSGPETGYGYQLVGRPVGAGYRVARFIEKPSLAAARRMVRSGRFLWNAGMFVMTSETLRDEVARCCPALASAARAFADASGRRLSALYRSLEFDSFDREVVERSAKVLGVRAQFRWHDVGSWQGLWEAVRGRKANVLSGPVLALDSQGVLARASQRLIVLFGVSDLVAIDSGDALLIARRSRSQELTRVTRELDRKGLRRYL